MSTEKPDIVERQRSRQKMARDNGWLADEHDARDAIATIETMREALEKIAEPATRFDTTNSPNAWAEVLAIREFARAALAASK